MGYFNNMRFAIAISLFDKFDDLAVLHDIFRYNFKHKFYLYVCSNHPNAQTEIQKRNLSFDGYVQGEDIEYTNELSKFEKRVSIVCRSTDTVQKSCKLAMHDSDYVMHIHCDAWPLDESKLLEHFHSIVNTQYDVAFRGLGYSANRDDAPLGHVDDHFFIFNSKQAKKLNLFRINTLEFLPHKLTVHGILMALILTKVGMGRIFFFDTFDDASTHECWENEKKVFPSYPVKPSLIDKDRLFIHIHTESFPSNCGKQLQSYYLKSQNLNKGENIINHINNNEDAHDLHDWLSVELVAVRRTAELLGYNADSFGQDIMSLKNTIVNTSIKKVLSNYTHSIINRVLSIANLEVVKKKPVIWPKQLSNYYKEKIKPELLNGSK